MTRIEICSFVIYFPGLHNVHAMFSLKGKIKVGSGKQTKFFCKKGPIKFGSLQNYAKPGSNFWILRIVVSLSLLCHPSLPCAMIPAHDAGPSQYFIITLCSQKLSQVQHPWQPLLPQHPHIPRQPHFPQTEATTFIVL